jgi:hypothetical protein
MAEKSTAGKSHRRRAAERHGTALPSGRLQHIRLTRALFLAGLVAALSGNGCSYSFSGSNLPSHIKTIAIPTFENETLQPNVDQEVTSGVVDRFLQDGRLKLGSERQADCRLSARVVKYENKVHNYGPDQSPTDYIVVLTVAAVLRDQVKNRDLWKDDAITRTAVYVPSGPSSGLTTEDAARKQAITDLASDLVSRTLEQW